MVNPLKIVHRESCTASLTLLSYHHHHYPYHHHQRHHISPPVSPHLTTSLTTPSPHNHIQRHHTITTSITTHRATAVSFKGFQRRLIELVLCPFKRCLGTQVILVPCTMLRSSPVLMFRSNMFRIRYTSVLPLNIVRMLGYSSILNISFRVLTE